MPKIKNKGGRPTEYSETIVKKLEKILKHDGMIARACNYAGISRETYYQWLKSKKGFSDKMDRAKYFANVMATRTLAKASVKDYKAAVEFLKRRDKRYKDKVEEDKTQTNINIDIKELEDMTPKQLEEIRQKLLNNK